MNWGPVIMQWATLISPAFNVLDPLLEYFISEVLYTNISCECTAGNVWYVEGDVDGSCSFIGLDITRMYNYLRHYWSELIPCPNCPLPMAVIHSNYEDIIAGIDFDYNRL